MLPFSFAILVGLAIAGTGAFLFFATQHKKIGVGLVILGLALTALTIAITAVAASMM